MRRAAEFLVQAVLLRVDRSVLLRAAAFVASPVKTPHRLLVAQRVPQELSALAAAVLAANSELLENSHPTDSAVGVNVFEDLATGFGELGRELFGVVVDLEGFLADSVRETASKLLCRFSKGGVCFVR